MDDLFVKKFRKSRDYINNCETLKIIRSSSKPKSLNSILNQIMDFDSYDKDAYFAYIKKNKECEANPMLSESINFMSLDSYIPPHVIQYNYSF